MSMKKALVWIVFCFLSAGSVMADCLWCNQGDCFMSIYNGAAECFPVGTVGGGAGCITRGSCIGAGKRPGGILYNTCKKPLGTMWQLAAVSVTSAPPAKAAPSTAKPTTRS